MLGPLVIKAEPPFRSQRPLVNGSSYEEGDSDIFSHPRMISHAPIGTRFLSERGPERVENPRQTHAAQVMERNC